MEQVIIDAGTGFAFPSQTAYLAQDDGLNSERTRAAEKQVEEWRAQSRLPFPEFDPDFKPQIEDTLDYPPKGAHDNPAR